MTTIGQILLCAPIAAGGYLSHAQLGVPSWAAGLGTALTALVVLLIADVVTDRRPRR